METLGYLLVILNSVLLVVIMHAEERDNLERERSHESMREQIVKEQREKNRRS